MSTTPTTRTAGRVAVAAASVGAVVAAAIGLGIASSTLLDHASESQARRLRATELMVSVQTIDGQEWRAVAGVDIDRVTGAIDQEARHIQALLRGFGSGPGITTIANAANEYITAVNTEVRLASLGQAAEAAAVDKARVDPAFERLRSLVSDYVASEARDVRRNLRTVKLLLWGVGAAIVAAMGAWQAALSASRARARAREHSAAVDRRFRTLVESSSDAVTIVRSDGTITVMTPDLGPLRPCVSVAEPTRIDQLLPPPALSQWAISDAHLRESGSTQTLDVSLARADGTVAWFEGRGSVLDHNARETVWTWRDVSERTELEAQLAHQAFHDTLTGLPNRALFHDRTMHALARSVRGGSPTTMLFCDLDDFKAINDTLGHAAGDELLRVIAKRINACVRPTDTVARFGGDEFVILLEDLDVNSALALAERITSVISHEVSLRGRTILPALSIGVAPATVGITAEEMLRNADTALYAAKRAGKGRSEVYSPDMHRTSMDQLQRQSDLSKALQGNELTVHYQPTIDLATGTVEGVEALLRWNHPQHGPISPAMFIPVAESSGLIVPIGRWVLREACATAAALQLGRSQPLSMHVNVSPRQLHDPSIVSYASDVLTETGLDPALLVLEVTEGVLLDDPLAIEVLHALRALGLRVAIDDFGTGYTSINYLQRLPVDILKIDRSFVSGDALDSAERTAFLTAIIGLATSLGLHSVAEGIEAADQLDELRRIGCHAGQGYLWSAATPAAEIALAIESINGRNADRGLAPLTPPVPR